MPGEPQQAPPAFDLEAAADQAIEACDGDARGAVKALVITNNYLTMELEHAWRQASPGYTRKRRKRSAD